MKKIAVSDVTLKSIYEQELSLTFREKLSIAEKLTAMKIDAIELPFLTDSKENEIIYRTIATSVKNATVKIPVGATEKSVEFAYGCVKGANRYSLQVVMPVSTAQMEYLYHLKAPQMLLKIEELVKTAKTYADDIEFVALDAFRAEDGFVSQCAKTAYLAGATTISISDDAGEALPDDYANMVKEIKSVCNAKVFVIPSNALSMSAYCAVQAIRAGADGVKTSVCGNYLCPTVFSDIVKTKKFDLDIECDIDVTCVKTITAEINGLTQAVAEPSE